MDGKSEFDEEELSRSVIYQVQQLKGINQPYTADSQ